MIVDVLAVLVVVTSGVVAGVLFGFAVSVLPAFFVMPTGRYIYSAELIGRNWDPMMPIIVLTSLAVDIVLAVLGPPGVPLTLFVLGALLLAGVSVVSHWCNVPINRAVKKVDPENIPADWHDPRPLWRRFHYLRTALAVLAVAVNATALGLL
ncbi:DUF1772 domain-containing protein [Actinophytocola sp.]|uniref:anthrone oxygenase family protein n=1 Tax=Actinophytocola sp. TaxID=1872138 RepID=UPI002D7EF32F|nr:DUF1772 domain-containing protein [Actinophytocola sp.]HET9141288.1 DUF1772 domain-containing protein [Actinophytocola sp.]